MRIVDANVLLYAVDEAVPQHEASNRWLERALAGEDRVGFASVVLLAFLRLSTNRALFPEPLSVDEAVTQLRGWTEAPGAVLVQPAAGHLERVGALLAPLGVGGNLVNDAHLAALAVEQRAEIVSYDRDFARFTNVRHRRPDELT